jgi:hypothetical protein
VVSSFAPAAAMNVMEARSSSFELRHHMTRCSNSTQEIFMTYSRPPSSIPPDQQHLIFARKQLELSVISTLHLCSPVRFVAMIFFILFFSNLLMIVDVLSLRGGIIEPSLKVLAGNITVTSISAGNAMLVSHLVLPTIGKGRVAIHHNSVRQ